MSFPKLLALFSLLLFGIIGIGVLLKGDRQTTAPVEQVAAAPLEVELDQEIRMAPSHDAVSQSAGARSRPFESQDAPQKFGDSSLPDANRIDEFFNKNDPKLPIIETITYKSRVAWQKGRPAWLSDYASHYSTSRHFIARSLNGKADYFKQDIAEGDRFNVLKPGKNISFYLLIDTSRSKLWFYYLDLDTNERVLVKTYAVSLGRFDSSKPSGMLTPLGKYSLGSKVAIYKPKAMGMYDGQKIEMIRIFGTRWLPFGKEISGCTAPAAGFGIHGVPWTPSEKGELTEKLNSLGKYESDGCIRLSTRDVEELFSIIITRPTIVELVKDFFEAKLPGIERPAGS